VLAFAAMEAAMRMGRAMSLRPLATYGLAALFMAPVIWWSAHVIVSRFIELHAVLGNALSAFRDRDFSLRLSARGDRELAELKQLYNDLADTVRADRRDLNEKEILLDTILQRTPVAVVLLNAANRIIYSNAAARELLAAGARQRPAARRAVTPRSPARSAGRRR
jgi:two-component system, NtrC family, nitrogen regulation sensor histidine kinase NtrY